MRFWYPINMMDHVSSKSDRRFHRYQWSGHTETTTEAIRDRGHHIVPGILRPSGTKIVREMEKCFDFQSLSLSLSLSLFLPEVQKHHLTIWIGHFSSWYRLHSFPWPCLSSVSSNVDSEHSASSIISSLGHASYSLFFSFSPSPFSLSPDSSPSSWWSFFDP